MNPRGEVPEVLMVFALDFNGVFYKMSGQRMEAK